MKRLFLKRCFDAVQEKLELKFQKEEQKPTIIIIR